MSDHKLHRLIEECAEVQKVACKILRFGKGFENPATGIMNIQELETECADLVEVISHVFDIDDIGFKQMRMLKKVKIEQWKLRELKAEPPKQNKGN